MASIDFQLHLPTDEEKGEYLGYQEPTPQEWAESLEQNTTEPLYIVPTVTNREFQKQDEEYLTSIKDADQVEIPFKAIEVDEGQNSVNIIDKEPEYGFFDDTEDEAEELLRDTRNYLEENSGAIALLSHPFSKAGGTFRDLDPDSQEIDLIEQTDRVYGDQNTNPWINTFRNQPWRVLNDFDDDRFGLNDDYNNLGVDIIDIGSSDVKDAELTGNSVTEVETAFDYPSELVGELDNSETMLDDIPPSIMLRKIGSGIGPVKSVYDSLEDDFEEKDKYRVLALGGLGATAALALNPQSPEILNQAGHAAVGGGGSMLTELGFRYGDLDEKLGEDAKYPLMVGGALASGSFIQGSQALGIVSGGFDWSSVAEGGLAGTVNAILEGKDEE